MPNTFVVGCQLLGLPKKLRSSTPISMPMGKTLLLDHGGVIRTERESMNLVALRPVNANFT